MNLFLTRLFSAICLYICLAIANQQNVIANVILVLGYRSFLVFSWGWENLFGQNALKVALITICTGLLINFCHFDIFASVLISAGLSISGYLIKKLAAETSSSAGMNKIALSAGNIISGCILFATQNNSTYSLLIIFVLIVFSIAIAPKIIAPNHKTVPLSLIIIKEDWMLYAAWLCIGMVIGIRIFGIYTILPIYLINYYGFLPEWYGPLLTLYGITVIITQMPAVLNKFNPTLNNSLIVLGLSCIVLGVPNILYIHHIEGAILWVSLLALEEIFAPYIDFHSAKEGKLFVKEISISLGAGICVCLMRWTGSPIIIASSACILLGIGYQLLRGRVMISK